MNLRYQPANFEVKARLPGKIKVIEIVPNQIVTKQILESPKVEAGKIVADTKRDILKLVVVERHRATGNVGVGFVRGFKLKQGALGSTVAHDAHNVVVVGTNDADIKRVIEELESLQGGQVAVAHGKGQGGAGVADRRIGFGQAAGRGDKKDRGLERRRRRAWAAILDAPFMTLSFLEPVADPGIETDRPGID